MYQIRQGVFETNSSSTHSLCICTKKEYEDFKDGKLSFNHYRDRLEDCNIPSNYMNRAKEYYEKNKTRFMLDWDNLSPEDQKNYMINEFDRSYKGDGIFKDNRTFEQFKDGFDGLESYTRFFTSPSGDEMVAFGVYGYDG